MAIGASVAFCVEDIVKGNCLIKIEDVQVIFNDMDFENPEAQVSFCKKYFWKGIEAQAEKVFYDLYAAGKIRQPKSLKYGKKLLAKPFPKWYKNYEDFRARQMSNFNYKRFIELLEAEGLHNTL